MEISYKNVKNNFVLEKNIKDLTEEKEKLNLKIIELQGVEDFKLKYLQVENYAKEIEEKLNIAKNSIDSLNAENKKLSSENFEKFQRINALEGEMKIKTLVKQIREPYWKHKAAGLNIAYFDGVDAVRFRCSYKCVDGRKLYPHLYEVDARRALSVYKRHQIAQMYGGTTLLLCPFDDMKIIEEGKNEAAPKLRPKARKPDSGKSPSRQEVRRPEKDLWDEKGRTGCATGWQDTFAG
jgi:hypothetical protein